MASNESHQKNFNAVLDLILGPEEFSESMKRVFVNVCHEPVEQLIYNMIINDGVNEMVVDDGSGDTWKTIVLKGTKLYHIHCLLNKKLERSSHYIRNVRDDYLLGCIVGEIQRRKVLFAGESESVLKRAIYQKYKHTDFSRKQSDLRIANKDDQYDNFDDYVKYLFTVERNGLMEIHSFHQLWSLLGIRRDDTTFKKVRPTRDELYIFCLGLALDWDVFNRLQHFLLEEQVANAFRTRVDGQPGFRKKTGYTAPSSNRDDVIKRFLINIDVRLGCVLDDLKGGVEFVPGMMVSYVNNELEEMRKNDPSLYPLVEKGKNGLRLTYGES